MTNAKSSQNHSVSATEMCDAIVTKLWSDRVQFISDYSFDCACATVGVAMRWRCKQTKTKVT